MRIFPFALFFAIAGIAGCNRPVSPAELNETCVRRLGDRASVTPERASRFCSCFLEASLKKVSAKTLAHEFETGSSEIFKKTLRPEFEQCKSAMSGGS